MQTHYITETCSRSYAARSRILLADPTELVGGPISTGLTAHGYEVLFARTVSQALSVIDHRKIDMALLELKFGDGDCLGLVAEIRKSNPRSRIVVHTWLADVRATVAVIKAGADDLIPKPLDVEFLVGLLIDGHRPGSNSFSSIPDIEAVRRKHILTVFQRCNRNLSRASRQLSLNRRSLQRLMDRYRDEM